MKGLIVFGEKGSGKDTVAKLINEYSEKSVSFFNIGDLVRDMSCIFQQQISGKIKKENLCRYGYKT